MLHSTPEARPRNRRDSARGLYVACEANRDPHDTRGLGLAAMFAFILAASLLEGCCTTGGSLDSFHVPAAGPARGASIEEPVGRFRDRSVYVLKIVPRRRFDLDRDAKL